MRQGVSCPRHVSSAYCLVMQQEILGLLLQLLTSLYERLEQFCHYRWKRGSICQPAFHSS
jgi:hypothetical protein